MEKRLKLTGLYNRFEIVIDGTMVEHAKPAPDLFLEAAKRLGIEPRTCLVLEDSPFGVQAAVAAGMPVILVPDLLHPTDEIRSLTLGVFNTLDEVRIFLSQK